MFRRNDREEKSKNNLNQIKQYIDRSLINHGIMLARFNQNYPPKSIQDTEFSVFSQWGEDGIIQFLTGQIEIKNKTFIEFGIQDFSECNCRFLMFKDNWSGFVIDSSKDYINRLQRHPIFWSHDLVAQCAFIDKDNVAGLLDRSGFDRDLGILSIDIDGMDYWVAKALHHWRPRILIMEYNAVFGAERAITVPYSPIFDRTHAHYSNLYFGASLKAIYLLAREWGYELVGSNRAGVNAFFVRRDLLNDNVRAVRLMEGFTPSKFRESRDQDGCLTYSRGDSRLELIRGLPVWDIERDELVIL
jgi:hypothetical protein